MALKTRPISWITPALKVFQQFPDGAKAICLTALTIAAEGGKADIAKPEGDTKMKGDQLRVVHGAGNVFHDLQRENADVEQFKAILAAEIIKLLDRERLSVRAAQQRTGIAAADFSRIRNAELGRFTVDRLMSIVNRLGSRIEVKVRVRRIQAVA